jgi:putative heme iron utilization protein
LKTACGCKKQENSALHGIDCRGTGASGIQKAVLAGLFAMARRLLADQRESVSRLARVSEF